MPENSTLTKLINSWLKINIVNEQPIFPGEDYVRLIIWLKLEKIKRGRRTSFLFDLLKMGIRVLKSQRN